MRDQRALKQELHRIDGKGYGAYKDLRNTYDFEDFTLRIDYVQGDPFASPSKVIVKVPQDKAGFPADTYKSRYGKSREIALRDYLTRTFSQACKRIPKGDRGSGKSGKITIDAPGQEVLERTSIMADDETVEARFSIGLPAFGRKVAGRHAEAMLLDEIPRIIDAALLFDNLDHDKLYKHVETNEDADVLRDSLEPRGLVAFIEEGAILPRKSGISQEPLSQEEAVAFTPPETTRTTIRLPNKGDVSGMGIPKGVTLLVGGGYHGKSTVVNALELGVYNHVPGDGRERVVTDPLAVKIRAEDGRSIEQTDISPFITNLPLNKDTKRFRSENASGSTSQAANIIEALEAGATSILIDEDTSATNFMVRDKRMQELVAKDKEPITPFIDKARQLYDEHGVSSMLVIGGSGDYFGIADKVVAMDTYKPYDVTEKAKEIAKQTQREPEGGARFGDITPRKPVKESVDASKGRKLKIQARGVRSIQFGTHDVELAAIEQLADESQTRAIAKAMHYARTHMDGDATMKDILNRVNKDIEKKGLDVVEPKSGGLARFRRLELAAALNRLRTLEVRQG